MKVTKKLNVKRVVQSLLTLAFVASLTGCSTSYTTNRCRDAADIVTIGIGRGVGAKARIGSLEAGLLSEEGMVALRGGAAGGNRDGKTEDIQLLLFGFEGFGQETIGYPTPEPEYNVFDERGKSFKAGSYNVIPFWSTLAEGVRAPYYYTQIELVAALLGSVRVGVNPGELVDFVLGWTTIDIYNDDVEATKTKDAK